LNIAIYTAYIHFMTCHYAGGWRRHNRMSVVFATSRWDQLPNVHSDCTEQSRSHVKSCSPSPRFTCRSLFRWEEKMKLCWKIHGTF